MSSEWPIARAWRLLRDLGATADEVAEELRRRGVKGVRYNPCTCPLAVLLEREGSPCFVQGMLGIALRTDILPAEDFGKGPRTGAMPDGARRFVDAFDRGDYSDLREAT